MFQRILLIMLVSLLVLSTPLISAAEPADQACISCHGFEFAQWRLSPHNLPQDAVTCTACHNEHADGSSSAGLRLPKAELCISCHGQDPEYQLLTGTCPVEYQAQDYAAAKPSAHNTADGCAACHMVVTQGRITIGGHTMLMVDSNGRKNVEACVSCHGELADFNLKDRQREVAERLTGLAEYLTTEKTQANQVYQFVKTDGSLGIHNPDYAIKLLADATSDVGGPEWVSRPSAELNTVDDECLSCKW